MLQVATDHLGVASMQLLIAFLCPLLFFKGVSIDMRFKDQTTGPVKLLLECVQHLQVLLGKVDILWVDLLIQKIMALVD
jgi:hypothetical protein